MNKLQIFTKRLQDMGLTDKQVIEAVDALDVYVTTLFAEMRDSQQGNQEANEQDD